MVLHSAWEAVSQAGAGVLVSCWGKAGQISKSGKTDALPWMNLMTEVVLFLVENSLLEQGMSGAGLSDPQQLPGTAADISKS